MEKQEMEMKRKLEMETGNGNLEWKLIFHIGNPKYAHMHISPLL